MPRTRSWLPALILPLAAALPARAQAPAAPAAPTGPVKLELKLKAGQSRTFRVTVDTDMSASLPGGTKKTTTRSTGTFEMTVDRVNADGSYAVRVKPISQSLTTDGKDTTPDTLPDEEVRANLSTSGRISDVTGKKPAGASEGASVMDAEDFLNTVFDKDVGLPTKSLAVGDSWSDKIDSPVDESQPKITLFNKLVALDLLNGKPVARVLHILAEPITDPDVREGVTMGGSIEGGGLGTMDLETGLVLDEQDVLRLKIDVTAENPASPAGTVNMGTVANIKIHVQSLPETSSAS